MVILVKDGLGMGKLVLVFGLLADLMNQGYKAHYAISSDEELVANTVIQRNTYLDDFGEYRKE